MRQPTIPPRRQRGTTLLEALVAFVALSLGILSVARLQMQLRLDADVARQRSEAVRLAQQDLETLRAFAVVAAAPDARSYAAIAEGSSAFDADSGYNTRYRLTRRIDAKALPNAKAASVGVDWTDRRGGVQQLQLDAIIAGHDPALSAALRLAPAGNPVKGVYGRSAWIPPAASDLGHGSSAFKPVGSGTLAYVFDNGSGLVTGRCAVDPTFTTQQLVGADLGRCDAVKGYLLSGVIRFSSSVPPAAARANDAPLPVGVALELSGGRYPALPSCSSEALKTVSYASVDGSRTRTVPIAATAASQGFDSWTELGDRHVAYHCIVYPPASGEWSGRSLLVPSGWRIGSGDYDYRVCRYVADLDGSGAIEANAEHPAAYAGVSGSLANQNFLVIRGSENCPSTRPADAGDGAAVFADWATLPHQP